VPYAWTT